ncbi:hypothetical protein JAO85_17275 [Comamonas sp. NyZ500]|uniref:hypothetical protein n=1 Tax=Comamonas sp. NyZ500 TaxID=2795732 RepID=UPI00192AB524|nr:hypothetical protein [Comamonas sp. NyZ500]MBL5979033.1 hypothetical protein [Comamonas sp. NyZ500]
MMNINGCLISFEGKNPVLMDGGSMKIEESNVVSTKDSVKILNADHVEIRKSNLVSNSDFVVRDVDTFVAAGNRHFQSREEMDKEEHNKRSTASEFKIQLDPSVARSSKWRGVK